MDMARELVSEDDISSSPVDAGIRLGGLRPEGRGACETVSLQIVCYW